MNKIGWCDMTINPIVGCTKVSPACNRCYAQIMATRLAGMKKTHHLYSGTIANGKWSGMTKFNTEAFLKIPRTGHKKIFMVSMGDMFHESVPFEWIDKCFDQIAMNPQHIFQILTKRPERALEYFKWLGNELKNFGLDSIPSESENPLDYIGELPNLWLGVTCENQEMADKRIPILLDIPTKVRFVSCEPLLEEIHIEKYLYHEEKRENNITRNSKKEFINRQSRKNLENNKKRKDKSRKQNTSWISSIEKNGEQKKVSCRSSQNSLDIFQQGIYSRENDYQSQKWYKGRQQTWESRNNDIQREYDTCNKNIKDNQSSKSDRNKKQHEQINNRSSESNKINDTKDKEREKASWENNEFISKGNECKLRYNLESSKRNILQLIIAGPETGQGKRECKKEWIESLYEQNKAAGISFFDKKNILGKNIKQFPE